MRQSVGAETLESIERTVTWPQAQASAILRMYLRMPNIVRQRIEAGHRDFVNELRVCTVLFAGFPSLKVRNLADAVDGCSTS